MLTLFDLTTALENVHVRSHEQYVYRQSLELNKQQLLLEIQKVEFEMLKLDGQEEILNQLIKLIKEQNEGGKSIG